MSIVQFTRFRVTVGREAAVLAARHASLRACQGSEPELRGAYLIRLPGGDWLDIVMWASRPGTEVFGPGPGHRFAAPAAVQRCLHPPPVHHGELVGRGDPLPEIRVAAGHAGIPGQDDRVGHRQRAQVQPDRSHLGEPVQHPVQCRAGRQRAQRQQPPHRVGEQRRRQRPQREQRRGVCPLQVVQDDQHRAGRRRLLQGGLHPLDHRQPLITEAAQRSKLTGGQHRRRTRAERAEQRRPRRDLIQLIRTARGDQQTPRRRAAPGLGQQPRLADTRRAFHHHDPARTRPQRIRQLPQPGQLGLAPAQWCHACLRSAAACS